MPVCISVAVKPRYEVLSQGNADVPSRTTAGGFPLDSFNLLKVKSFQNRAPIFKLVSRLVSCLRRRAIQVQLALGTVAVATQ